MNICDDNRTATIEAAKTAMIKGTNIEDSPDEMKVLDSLLLRCWQMGWLDRYAPTRHFNAMPKVISERMAAGNGSNVTMQPSVPPMPYNTSNALDALADAYKGRSNALKNTEKRETISIEQEKMIVESLPSLYPLQKFEEEAINALVSLPIDDDAISRKAAIEVVQNRPMMLSKEKVLLINDLEKLPPAQTESCEDTVSRQRLLSDLKELVAAWEKYPVMAEQIKGVEVAIGYVKTIPPAQPESDSSQIAAQIIHDAIDNTTFAEEAYPGIKEQMHRSVEEWKKLQPVFTEIAEEYKKACEISYIIKPLAYALHEVWKKHDRRDTKRNE